MRNIQNMAVAVAAAAGLTHAAVEPQHALLHQPAASGLQVTMRKDLKLQRMPERASVEYTVSANATSEDEVLATLKAQVQSLTAELDALAAAPVLTWSRLDRPYEAVEHSLRYAFRREFAVDIDAPPHPEQQWWQTAFGKATFADLTSYGAAQALFRNASSLDVQWVEWELTDATLDAARDQFAVMAVDECERAGAVRARALGKASARLVAIEEENFYHGETRWSNDRVNEFGVQADDGEVAKAMDLTMTAKCTVVLE